jgi:hypothetical protein
VEPPKALESVTDTEKQLVDSRPRKFMLVDANSRVRTILHNGTDARLLPSLGRFYRDSHVPHFQSILLRLFLPYIAIWLIFIVGARLPASVFSNVPGRPLVNAFWTGAAALLFVPIGLVLIGAILEGPILMVPFLWLTLWLTLCARAAALTRHRLRSAQQA